MTDDPFEPMRRQLQAAAEAAARAFRPFLEQREQFAQQMEAAAEMGRRMQEAFAPLARQIEEAQQSLAPLLQEASRTFDELPDRNRRALRVLATHGWYLDPELAIPDLFEVSRAFESGAVEAANDELCRHFDARASDIEQQLCSTFPNRKALFEQSFAAHRGGQYALSIPVFLAQADGLCHELAGVQLYSRRSDGIVAVVTQLQLEAGSFTASLLSPLVERSPLTAGTL